MRHLLGIDDLSRDELAHLIEESHALSRGQSRGADLDGRTLLMVFAKPSLRTRVSLDVAMTQLGGHAIDYPLERSTAPRKETLGDLAASASQYVDAISARLFDDADLREIASRSRVPVVNALTDGEHPLQAIADLLTIDHHVGLDQATVAFVGDASANVACSLALACTKLGVDLRVGAPQSLALPNAVAKRAEAMAADAGSELAVSADPQASVHAADVVYTDTWMSYHVTPGDAEDRHERLAPYRVDRALMDHAAPDAVFMHCLPATRGEEVTDDVLDGPESVVLDQAANRLSTAKAVLSWLLDWADPGT